MLIDFTVENSRSIKEPVTLSAVAHSHGANEQDNKIAQPFSYSARKLEILPVLGIFGANASGKSNVVNSLGEILFYNTLNSLDPQYMRLDSNFAIPFKLDRHSSKSPSKFELRVLAEGNIYSFQLWLNRGQILREKMSYVPRESKRAASRLLFERIWDDSLEAYSVNNGKDFGESYIDLQRSLNKSKTFLGLLAGSFKNDLLKPFTSWLLASVNGARSNSNLQDRYMSCLFLFNDEVFRLRDRVKTILKRFDTAIDDIEIKSKGGEGNEDNAFEVWVTHKTGEGIVKWPLSEESLGTQKLFDLATKVFFALEGGGLVLVDELGFGTHPHINREIIRLFQDKEINKNNAQLIFTSHDSTLLSRGFLRRDQVWFTQKRRDGSTDLYSLSDFSGIRSDLLMDRAYLDGRFRAVPVLPDEEEIRELVGV